MKSNQNRSNLFPRSLALTGLIALATTSLHGQIVIDGNATPLENYLTLGSTQTTETNLDNANVLASMRYVASSNRLNLTLAGRATNNAMILFIDAKPGGVNRITPDLINPQPGGEHEHINRLAFDSETGLTFEPGFEPEIAIRIFGDDVSGVKHAYVNVYDFLTHTQSYLGESHATTVSGGPVRALRTSWVSVGTGSGTNGYNTHRTGAEMDLNLAALGITSLGQTIKLSAILVSGIILEDTERGPYIEGSNQALGPVESFMTEINQFNFENEAGTQTLSLVVDGLSPTGDEDGDGLLNSYETKTGIFASNTNTGTDPDNSDSDGDGYPDGAEVDGSPTLGLGYISDPNLPNYGEIAVPGSFNLPTAWNFNNATNNPSTGMIRESTTLTGQYQWKLDYLFLPSQRGAFAYKFNTGSTSAIQWGGGSTPGLAVATTGSDIPDTIDATGIHRFTFNQKTLAYTFTRPSFPDVAAYLAAYGVSAGSDGDGDGILNENEFAANTDPTQSDTDGDAVNDLLDPQPLNPAVANDGYEGWASSIVGDATKGGDPDKDGFTNFQEYLFGTAPNSGNGALFTSSQSGSNLTLRWLQRGGSVSYQLLEGTNPGSGWGPSSAIVTTDADQSGVAANYIRKTTTIPIQPGKKFFRVSGQE